MTKLVKSDKGDNVTPFSSLDPKNINVRLYNQVSRLLDQLEKEDDEDKIALKERVAALIAIGRLQIVFGTLRKGQPDGRSGTTVKKYSAAFTSNASRRRAGGGGNSAGSEPEPDDWFERDSGADDEQDG